jgi:hypothetical protein
MLVSLTYPHTRSGACSVREAAAIWAVASQFRRQVAGALDDFVIEPRKLPSLCKELSVNGRAITIDWDFEHAVHDDSGALAFGVCETDGESIDTAYVSINGPLLKDRPDLLRSTSIHELGHAVLDVPGVHGAQGTRRCYRSFTASAAALLRSRNHSEWRANEFMGAVLAPPLRLHRELLRHARSEELALVRAPHCGRPAWPAVDGVRNDSDVVAGVIDVVAQEFGLSPSFIEVRLDRYGLISRGRKGVVT